MGGQKAISKHTVSLVKNEKKLIGKHVVKPRGKRIWKEVLECLEFKFVNISYILHSSQIFGL